MFNAANHGVQRYEEDPTEKRSMVLPNILKSQNNFSFGFTSSCPFWGENTDNEKLLLVWRILLVKLVKQDTKKCKLNHFCC